MRHIVKCKTLVYVYVRIRNIGSRVNFNSYASGTYLLVSHGKNAIPAVVSSAVQLIFLCFEV